VNASCVVGESKLGEFVGQYLGQWPGPSIEEDSGQVTRGSCDHGVLYVLQGVGLCWICGALSWATSQRGQREGEQQFVGVLGLCVL
jgi:hypothetical protein